MSCDLLTLKLWITWAQIIVRGSDLDRSLYLWHWSMEKIIASLTGIFNYFIRDISAVFAECGLFISLPSGLFLSRRLCYWISSFSHSFGWSRALPSCWSAIKLVSTILCANLYTLPPISQKFAEVFLALIWCDFKRDLRFCLWSSIKNKKGIYVIALSSTSIELSKGVTQGL